MGVLLGVVGLLLGLHWVAAWWFCRWGTRLAEAVSSEGDAPLASEVPAVMLRFAKRSRALSGRVVLLRQECEMRLSRGADWKGMEAEQTIGVQRAGFVWRARMGMGPLTLVRVVDAFVGGVGQLRVRLLGSVPVGSATGKDVDRGEAMRYLAELPWAPDAILSNAQLRWDVLEDGEVEVSLALPDGPASVRFSFDECGDIVQVEGLRPVKERDAEGAALVRPWRCFMRDYGELGGRRIPLQGEAGYVYEDGYEAYWRGRVIAYEVR